MFIHCLIFIFSFVIYLYFIIKFIDFQYEVYDQDYVHINRHRDMGTYRNYNRFRSILYGTERKTNREFQKQDYVYINRDVYVYQEIEKGSHDDGTENQTRSAQDTDKTDKHRRKHIHATQTHRNRHTDKECA